MIGGNITGLLQVKKVIGVDEIGCNILDWETPTSFLGFLDLMGQTTNRDKFDSKIEESTHIFICDYKPLDKEIRKASNVRMEIDNELYDVLYIDDPMNLHKHYEIYLKYVGGQE